jgi:hypothetical protein
MIEAKRKLPDIEAKDDRSEAEAAGYRGEGFERTGCT